MCIDERVSSVGLLTKIVLNVSLLSGAQSSVSCKLLQGKLDSLTGFLLVIVTKWYDLDCLVIVRYRD